MVYFRLFFLIVALPLLGVSCSGDVEEDVTQIPIDEPESSHAVTDVLLYSKNPNGHNELYRLENGQESLVLSDPQYDYWWSKVSPDKQKILLYRSLVNPEKNHDDYQNAELVLANIDGSNAQVLIAKNDYGWNAQGVCRWNKDGSKILMCAEIQTGVGLQWRLITTDALGKNPKVLSDRWAIDCNFSVDNKSIVFMGYKDNNLSFDFTELELQKGDYDPLTDTVTNVVSLTENTTRDHDPDFSPANEQLVFSAGNASYSDVDLVLYNLETKKETILLNDAAANGGSMCWSTNGKNIFFHSLEVFKSPFRIKCIDVETGVVTTLLEDMGNSYGFFHPEAY